MIYTIVIVLSSWIAYIYLNPHVRQYLYARRALKHGAKPIHYVEIRFPMGLPTARDVQEASRSQRLLEYIRELYDRVGVKTTSRYALGSFTISTVDPENIKAILATQFKDFELGDRLEKMGPLLGAGIFTLDGEAWSHSRALLRPQFTRQQISHLDNMEHHIEKVISLAKRNYECPTTIDGLFDVQQVFFRFSLDTATEFLFGESVDSLSDNPRHDATQFASALQKSLQYLTKRRRARKYGFLFNSHEFQEWNAICHKFVDRYVYKALDSKETENQGRYVFLYALAQQTRDPLVLRYQCLNILLAGRDSTASSLSFSLYTLARYPHIFNKLRQIILNEFGTGTEKISFESLKRTTYLQHFISEVLRMYPVVPNNSRTAVRDTTLPRGGGPDGMSPILVEKGTKLIYHVCVMHRLKEFYGDDADEFRPERWEGKAPSWEFLPFNGGPRICLGQQFALTEISYVLVRLLQSFKEIRSTPEKISGEPSQTISLTLRVGNGVHVNLVPA